MVEYTIPTTGFYYVAAVGAQGGSAFGNGGGYGAGVGGTVFLDMGTELDIVAGGAGMMNFIGLPDGGGGGGSFVWDPTAVPPQPVPEPSTWAMMLIGFAGLAGLQPASGFRSRGDTRLKQDCRKVGCRFSAQNPAKSLNPGRFPLVPQRKPA